MLLSRIRNRWQASLIHLGLSVSVFAVLFSILIFIWFPGDLIKLGGYQGLKIAAGVDIILGPLLTLMVFNLKKKELIWDLTFISVIQLAALLVGVWLINQERPYFQVMSHDGVHVITKKELKELERMDMDLSISKENTHRLTYLDIPNNESEIINLTFKTGLTKEIPLSHRIDLYRELTTPIPHKIIWMFEKRDLNKSLDCYTLPMYSKHLEAQSCFSLTKGIIKIEN
ncbi:MAG: hypothetical protein K6L80_14860 [Agarilytica sp.]